MKAMMLRGPNTPFEMVQVPDPVAGPGEAVARVITCGAGLTIQHAKAGRRKINFPRIIGHEITAEIVAVGAGVTGLKPDDGVTAYFYLNCGHCRYCLSMLEPLCTNSGGNVGLECDGGYAEYIKLPAHIFIKYPEGLDYKKHPAEMGVITDALATPYKVLRRASIKAGETVAVFGAGGGVGIHQVMMAKWARARVIAVDVAADKFDACRKAGADEVPIRAMATWSRRCAISPTATASTWRSITFAPRRHWRRASGRSVAAAVWSFWAAPPSCSRRRRTTC